MANKVKWGVRNLHYATRTAGQNGEITFGVPVKIPGTVNVTLSPQGDSNPFYADDIEYFRTIANNGYSGSIELALLPADFRQLALGEILSEDNILYEKADNQGEEFAIGFEVQGDDKAAFIWLYNCVAERPDINAATQESSITPQTETINITCRTDYDGFVCARSTDQTAKGKTDAWFSAVVKPDPVQ